MATVVPEIELAAPSSFTNPYSVELEKTAADGTSLRVRVEGQDMQEVCVKAKTLMQSGFQSPTEVG